MKFQFEFQASQSAFHIVISKLELLYSVKPLDHLSYWATLVDIVFQETSLIAHYKFIVNNYENGMAKL